MSSVDRVLASVKLLNMINGNLGIRKIVHTDGFPSNGRGTELFQSLHGTGRIREISLYDLPFPLQRAPTEALFRRAFAIPSAEYQCHLWDASPSRDISYKASSKDHQMIIAHLFQMTHSIPPLHNLTTPAPQTFESSIECINVSNGSCLRVLPMESNYSCCNPGYIFVECDPVATKIPRSYVTVSAEIVRKLGFFQP